VIDRSIECITTKSKSNKRVSLFSCCQSKSYPRMKSPDKAGIRRRLLGSRTEANANLAAVNVKNDSVVFCKIRLVCCK